MQNRFKILDILYENINSFVSGEELSEKFNVTRTSIANYIKELKSDGYNVEAKTNCGYKLLSSFDVYNEYEIKKVIREFEIIHSEEENDSTNNIGKKLASENGSLKYLVTLGKQLAGRGRYGRSFFSDTDKGLYFSLALNPNKNAGDICLIPIIAAVSVIFALKEICKIEANIKWPNDILYKKDDAYKKLCGILTEASVEAESGHIKYIVAGIGLNVNNEPNDFPEGIREIAASVYEITGKKFQRTDILKSITENFMDLLLRPNIEIVEIYKKYVVTDRDINFYRNGRKFSGRIKDVEENGNLTVESDGKIFTLESGEINFI